jgi:hypothetical protein
MLIHSVYFWLKADLTQADRDQFRKSLETLRDIDAAYAVYVGSPALLSDRPVIDSSYDFALTVIFENHEEHDEYQAHDLHRAFLEHHADKWDRIVIYDAD